MKSLKRFNESNQEITANLEKIDRICKSLFWGGYPEYTINEDGTVDVEGNVELGNRFFRTFPIKFGNVLGDFNCSHNHLKNLVGGPEFVSGDFYCYSNELTSLEGLPKTIGGSLIATSNNLTSLKELKETTIGESITFYKNKLTSLEGCPEFVGGDFTCAGNPLTNLIGGPQIVMGSYDCSQTEIWDFEGIARFVDEDIKCDFNPNLWDPTHLRDCEARCLDFVDPRETFYSKDLLKIKTPIKEIYNLFAKSDSDPEGYEKFRMSMDYGYIRWDKGKPGVIKWKLKESLDEFGITYPGDKFFAKYKVLK